MNAENVLSLSNSGFCFYCTFCAVSMVKMLSMLVFIYLFPLEDRYVFISVDGELTAIPAHWVKGANTARTIDAEQSEWDKLVRRFQRAYRNDMENLVPVTIISFLYLFTNPPSSLAFIVFAIVLIFRFLHTYVFALKNVSVPLRAAVFSVPYIITGLLSIKVVMFFF